jgi:ABC-type dipeptide/oligopeptide/nickel transport system permease subunit
VTARRVAGLTPGAWFGAAVFVIVAVCAAGAPLWAPHDPLEQDLLAAQLPPVWSTGGEAGHPLGTDSLGRDVLSRLVYATRPALVVALAGALGAGVPGVLLGLLAGGLSSRVDGAISRLVDVWVSFPAVLLAMVLVAVLGSGLWTVVLAIALIDWTRFCRVVRTETRRQTRLDYVTAARALGMPLGAILAREVLPNVLPLVATLFTLEMGVAVVVETILSFVGLSVSGDVPTWGGMIQEGRLYVNQTPWLLGLPVACLVTVVVGFNALGDGLRASLDPLVAR